MRNKKPPCKICGDKHSSRGFCKYHAWALSKNKIDLNGIPVKGLFYDDKMKLKKEKDTLGKTVKESVWYVEWKHKVISKHNKRCAKCGKGNVQLTVHHSKKRFAAIINEAKAKFDAIEHRMDYCKKQHTDDIAEPLCRSCHADVHFGEKMYSSLLGKVASGKCKICGGEEYCRGFCSKHYKSFQIRSIDIDGNRLKPARLSDRKQPCIVCGEESAGRGGKKLKFCKLHLSRFWQKYIDIDGKHIKEIRNVRSNGKCKVCQEKHFSKGFCLTHYNRFKIGQIDSDGKKLRELGIFTSTKGSSNPRIYIEHNGVKLSYKECANLIGVCTRTMIKRIKKWGADRALTTPRMKEHDTRAKKTS